MPSRINERMGGSIVRTVSISWQSALQIVGTIGHLEVWQKHISGYLLGSMLSLNGEKGVYNQDVLINWVPPPPPFSEDHIGDYNNSGG